MPLGLLDDPARPWEGLWRVDLDGHLLVLGGPASGKTTTLHTIALGIAPTRTPAEVRIYGVDLLGRGPRALSGLPRVRAVAHRPDRTDVLRVVDEVHRALDERSPTVLLLDGWDQVPGGDVERKVHELLARPQGIHVVATARRWRDVLAPQRIAFANRIELRLAEPAGSSIDGALAWTLPATQPGRALTTAGLFGQVALIRRGR